MYMVALLHICVYAVYGHIGISIGVPLRSFRVSASVSFAIFGGKGFWWSFQRN